MSRRSTAKVSGFVLLLGACSSANNSDDSTINGSSAGGARFGSGTGASAAASTGATGANGTGATGTGATAATGSGGVANGLCEVGAACSTPGSLCATATGATCTCVSGAWGLCVNLNNTGGTSTTGTGGVASGLCEVGAACSTAGSLCATATGATCTCVNGAWGLCVNLNNTGGTSTTGTGGVSTTDTGGTGPCVPTPCASNNCGATADGCGGLIDCDQVNGPCNGVCGAIAPSVCTPICVPKDCATLGYNCGFASDGCGGLLDCGTCAAPQQCGANNLLYQCGVPGGGPSGCINFCEQVPTCAAGTTTTIRGAVYAPNGTLPLPNAIVYVPNGSMTPPYGVGVFNDGVANGNGCECNVTGNPLVQTTSGTDGSFILQNVPAGANIPLVIQLGRWRRLVTISSVTECTTTTLTANQTRLPSRQGETSTVDAIPFMALATGDVDGLECVLRKMGVQDSQFTNPGGGGRIEMYRDNGATLGGTPSYTQLVSSQAMVDQYDALIFPCRGTAHDESAAFKQRILDVPTNTNAYVNKGGRAFFTHFSYAWLYSIAPSNQLPWLSTTNTRNVDSTHWDDNIQVQVNTGFARGQTFSDWLALGSVNALSGTNPPQITVLEAREDMHTPVTLPIATAQEWLSTYQATPRQAALHVTFDAPWGYPADQQCGRVLWSGFHVTTAGITGGHTNGLAFPTECSSEFTAQEKVLAYMMFDMTSCITPPPPCIPLTCAQQNITCGPAGDGCGGLLDCGPCPPNDCIPITCPPDNLCQMLPDGCGKVLYCGAC